MSLFNVDDANAYWHLHLSYVVGAAIAVLVAVVASLAPARRAATVQPMVAMRSE